MKIELNNRVALVLGETGAMTTAICKQLSQSGARVVIVCRDGNVGDWQTKLNESGGAVSAFKADITDFDECVRLVETIESSIGPIDIIINGSELNETIPFHTMNKAEWENMISDNIDAVFNICRNLAEKMSNRGFGRIINISSIIGRMGRPGQSHRAAAKAGIHGFTMALAQELARKGVTVNTVSPGYIAEAGNTDNETISTIPAGRPGSVEEVASLVDFLCSDQAGFINGADIPVNGGQYIH